MEDQIDKLQKEGVKLENWQNIKMSKFDIVMAHVFGFIMMLFVLPTLGKSVSKSKQIKKKIKYFKPTIKEGFWGKSITWEMRDTPLTDEQLSNLK